ncbi:MAG: DUF1788 domain-containing protein [Sulfobacillus thermotolerans]|nr:DUF1788 domain-containing protein [Sulfobacillus thermotolerans]
MDNLTKRLDYLAQLIQTPEFLERRGLGNELAFYILDYEPSEELRVRSFIQYLVTHSPVRIASINLYGAILDIFAGEVGMETLWEMELAEGSSALLDAMRPVLETERLADAIWQNAQGAQTVFLHGVGTAYPLIRSHSLLNRLHSRFTETPVVLFFPGRYTGTQMSLFGLKTDDNYYRALRVEPLVGKE